MQISPFIQPTPVAPKFAATNPPRQVLSTPRDTGDQVHFQGKLNLNKAKGIISEKVSGWQQISNFFSGGESPAYKHFEQALSYAMDGSESAPNESGDRPCHTFDGTIFLPSAHGRPNAKKAESELKKAARCGKNMAVAEVYAKGFGVIQPNAAKTREYLERAAYQDEWDALKGAVHLAQGFGPMKADAKAAVKLLDKRCASQTDLMPYVIRIYDQGLGQIQPDPAKVQRVRQALIESHEANAQNPDAPYTTQAELIEVIRSYAQSATTLPKANAMLEEIITFDEKANTQYSKSFIDNIFSNASQGKPLAALPIEGIKLVAAGSGQMSADGSRADELVQALYRTCDDWTVILQLADLLLTGYGDLQANPEAARQIITEYVEASQTEGISAEETLQWAVKLQQITPELAAAYPGSGPTL